jgi:hypothetical protein
MSSSRATVRTRTRAPNRKVALSAFLGTLIASATILGSAPTAHAALNFEVPSLDGSGNNVANPNWGRAGTPYTRVGAARYTDGRGAPVTGPNARFVSNRIFGDSNINIFSERGNTAWIWVWGQFLDHTFGLRQDGTEPFAIPFNSGDPLERYTNDFGVISLNRSAAAPGTGVNNVRQQINTESSYLNAAAVYGNSASRLDWIRDGSADGNPTNNAATLMLPGGFLPTAAARGNPATAPGFDVDGVLRANPSSGFVAGDVRANENIQLTATHTLFAREHNRIVSRLPNNLTAEEKFQIARRVIIAMQQYITFNEFLPATGVKLPFYTGYRSNVNAALSNEFAAAGYRMHSMIHDALEIVVDEGHYTDAQLDAFAAEGMEIIREDGEVEVVVPLNVMFFNPVLLTKLGMGPVLQAIGAERQYRNDEQFANALRSVLFQVPQPGSDPACRADEDEQIECFRGVSDLGAIDIVRALDHGLPSYNQLRQAYGLAPKTSFTAVTGESTDQFPSHPSLTPGNEINDPNSLDVVALTDVDGTPIDLNDADAVEGTPTGQTRRTTVAARLRAIYGSVNNIDAFTGIVSEPRLPGSELGELQTAIWTRQFLALRDGDRFFYGNPSQDAVLDQIRDQYGVDFRRTLKDVIVSNSDVAPGDLNNNVFMIPDADLPPAICQITSTVNTQWPGGYQVSLRITNTGSQPINGWNLQWQMPTGQRIYDLWSATVTQSGPNVSVRGTQSIAPGASLSAVGYNATWDNVTNAKPQTYSLNGRRCTTA